MNRHKGARITLVGVLMFAMIFGNPISLVKASAVKSMKVSFENENSRVIEPRLTHQYVTTFTDTDYAKPRGLTYDIIYWTVSAMAGINSIPGGIVATIATSILNNSISAPIEIWTTTKRNFYGVYDSTGSFQGYYYVGYTVTTSIRINGVKTVIDTETGSYTSLGVYSLE